MTIFVKFLQRYNYFFSENPNTETVQHGADVGRMDSSGIRKVY